MNHNGLAKWFQQNKETASLLCRRDQSLIDICSFPLKQTAFPDAFLKSTTGIIDMQAETD